MKIKIFQFSILIFSLLNLSILAMDGPTRVLSPLPSDNVYTLPTEEKMLPILERYLNLTQKDASVLANQTMTFKTLVRELQILRHTENLSFDLLAQATARGILQRAEVCPSE